MDTPNDIADAARALREGKVGIFPTETVYGLGANALDERAVAQIFSLKSRPHFNPLIIHHTLERAFHWASRVPEEARRLAERFWPGPLALVVPKTEAIPYLVTGGLETVAIRVPDHPVAQALLERCDFPVAAPSANFFQALSPTELIHLDPKLRAGAAFALDGGPCRVGLESTIVAFLPAPVVLRAGGISLESLREVVPEISIYHPSPDERPRSPGMLARHYSPRTPVRFVGEESTAVKKGALFFDRPFGGDFVATEFLSRSGDLNEAARNLFRLLRRLDDAGVEEIVATLVPETGLGLAINDRLRRARA